MVGEYLALAGGPSLILNSSPYFTLHLTKSAAGSDSTPLHHTSHFHPHSPAGLWLRKNKALVKGYHFNFYDPHQGEGGLGASSAQFALLSTYFHPKLTVEERISQYRELIKNDSDNSTREKHCYLPSGADVAAQTIGHQGLAIVDPSLSHYEWQPWPFSSLSYCVVYTKNTLETHTHLNTLRYFKKSFIQTLDTITKQTIGYLKKKQVLAFCEAIQCYGDALIDAQLTTPHTQHLLTKCLAQPGVMAAKGCGAMGADTILVLVKTEALTPFQAWLKARQLFCAAASNKDAKE